MKIRVLDYFNDFHCIAGNCESTCCANWEVVIDKESLEKYKNIQGPYKDVLDGRVVKNDENEDIFLLKENRCSFLNQDNTCDMYINLGKDNLCYTCTQYPRFIEKFLDLKEMGLSLSCPEAARIILKEDRKISFKLSSDDEPPILPTDINEKDDLATFLLCRDIIFKIIEDTTLSFKGKITIIISFITDIQTKIDLGDMIEIPSVIEEYSDFHKENFVDTVLGYLNEDNLYKKFSIDEKFSHFIDYLEIFKNLKQLDNSEGLDLENDIEFIKSHKDSYLSRKGEFKLYHNSDFYKQKNVLIYFIFRYFLKGFFNYDFISKTKFAIVSSLMIFKLSYISYLKNGGLSEADLVKICYTYSKNIEHLEENIENLEDAFEENDIFLPFYIVQMFD